MMEEFFTDASAALPSLQGKTVRIAGIQMKVDNVRDDRVYVKQGGALIGWEITKLEHSLIFQLVGDKVNKESPRRKAVFLYFSVDRQRQRAPWLTHHPWAAM
jgi:hypothetical protein